MCHTYFKWIKQSAELHQTFVMFARVVRSLCLSSYSQCLSLSRIASQTLSHTLSPATHCLFFAQWLCHTVQGWYSILDQAIDLFRSTSRLVTALVTHNAHQKPGSICADAPRVLWCNVTFSNQLINHLVEQQISSQR